jgi:hypothetical protein
MTEAPFEIKTVKELYRILALQSSVTHQASAELDEIVTDITTAANHKDEEYLATEAMKREVALIGRYALQPTLTEYKKSTTAQSAFKPGASYAVALLVGEVILGHIRGIADIFPKVHRNLLMVMLHEFQKERSQDSDLVDTFVRVLHVDAPTTGRQTAPQLYRLLRPLAEAFLLVASRYDLIENEDDAWKLTELGFRVMLHLVDIQRFIETIVEAHKRLQGAGCKL